MAQKTDAQLIADANVIKNETAALANTATRVGTMLVDEIESKINIDKIDTDGTLADNSDTKVASQKAVKTYVDSKSKYKEYVALLSFLAGQNPTIDTLFNNELGSPIVWTRTGEGLYSGTLVGAFTVGKTAIPNMLESSKISDFSAYIYAESNDTIKIINRSFSTNNLTDINATQAFCVTIKVYL